MKEGYIEYVQEFLGKLTDVIDRALEIGNPMIAKLKVDAMYGVELPVAAATTGHELGIPAESSIAFMVIGEGIRFNKGNNRFSLLFSKEKRDLYDDHRKIMAFVDFAMNQYEGTDILAQFLAKLIVQLSRK